MPFGAVEENNEEDIEEEESTRPNRRLIGKEKSHKRPSLLQSEAQVNSDEDEEKEQEEFSEVNSEENQTQQSDREKSDDGKLTHKEGQHDDEVPSEHYNASINNTIAS